MEQIIIENGGTTGISNYSVVVAAVKERLSQYEGLVVLEEAIPQAKQEVAELRRIAKTASDLRISVKKEHEAKISETINQLKEITDLYTLAANKIDAQVKEYEQKAQEAKEAEIKAYWKEHIGKLDGFISLKTVWNQRWLNKGYQMTDIKLEIDETITKATSGIRSIMAMHTPHEQTLLRTFFSTLDLQRVLDEKTALDEQLALMEKQKAEREAQEAERLAAEKANVAEEPHLPQESVSVPEPTVTPETDKKPVEDDFKQYTLCFKVTGTRNQILALREFLIANNIRFVKGK